MNREKGLGGKIEKVTIPDSDMPGWIEVMRNSDLNQEEIDWFLARLNSTYAKAKGIPDIEGELTEIEKYYEKEYGRRLTEEQRQYFRAGIAERLKNDKDKK